MMLLGIRNGTSLRFAPTGQRVRATIVMLSHELITTRIDPWWNEPGLNDVQQPDRFWDWHDGAIEQDDRILQSVHVGIVTEDGNVQGGMVVSLEPVASSLYPGRGSLHVEWLFAAPRNRPDVRVDGRDYFRGAGANLLCWATRLSHHLGHRGRLRLEGSEAFLDWYESRGFVRLDLPVVTFEQVNYTPMELRVTSVLGRQLRKIGGG